MPSVADVLRQSGFSDEQIKGLDAKVITTFDGILSTATAAQERAELEHRSNRQFYESEIAPALNNWGTEKGNLEAELAFYRAQNEAARVNGFVPAEAPQHRDGQGRYVPNTPGSTPGSPTFDVQKIYERAGDAVGIIADLQWQHQQLYGVPMPISPTELIRQADAQRLDPKLYAAKAFNWDSKRAELQKKSEEEHDAGIRKQAEAARDAYWAERTGSNPDVRPPQPSRYSDMSRAVHAKALPDPLQLNDQQRRAATAQMIRKDISERGNDAA
jgi:hypothetical protein